MDRYESIFATVSLPKTFSSHISVYNVICTRSQNTYIMINPEFYLNARISFKKNHTNSVQQYNQQDPIYTNT